MIRSFFRLSLPRPRTYPHSPRNRESGDAIGSTTRSVAGDVTFFFVTVRSAKKASVDRHRRPRVRRLRRNINRANKRD